MAIEIRKRKSAATGAVSYLAVVRVGRFKSASKTVRVDTTAKAARTEAVAWARAYQESLRKQPKGNEPRPDVTQITIAGLIKEYLAEPEVKELATYADIDRLLGWWVLKYATHRVREFGVRTLRDARVELSKGRAPATVNRHLSALRSAWNWGIGAELILQERAWPKRLLLKEPRGRIRFLSDDEITGLLKAAEPDPVVRAAIMVSIATGLRQGELLRLQWKDINFAKQTATVHESKNDARRAVHLTASAVEALTQLQQARVRSLTHVFYIESGKPLKKSLLEARWNKIRKAAALDDFRWHDLRHTCASILARKGATLLEIGSVLGHKSPSMTQRYSHLVQGAPVKGHAELDTLLRSTFVIPPDAKEGLNFNKPK